MFEPSSSCCFKTRIFTFIYHYRRQPDLNCIVDLEQFWGEVFSGKFYMSQQVFQLFTTDDYSSLPQVLHENTTISHKNFWTVRLYPNKDTCWALHIYFDQSVLLCDVTPCISLPDIVIVADFSTSFVLCYIHFPSCHHKYCVLVSYCLLIWYLPLSSFHDSCTVLIFKKVQNLKYNWQLAQNSIICLACLRSKQYCADSHMYIDHWYPFWHCVCTLIDQKINFYRLWWLWFMQHFISYHLIKVTDEQQTIVDASSLNSISF